jgi:hypothetical protein
MQYVTWTVRGFTMVILGGLGVCQIARGHAGPKCVGWRLPGRCSRGAPQLGQASAGFASIVAIIAGALFARSSASMRFLYALLRAVLF